MRHLISRPRLAVKRLPLTALLLAPLLLTSPTISRAELPPTVYRQWQKEAPEALTIKVLSVTPRVVKTSNSTQTTVTVLAEVTGVKRTKTKLKPHKKITIQYMHTDYDMPIAGPSQVPILQVGQTCPAYLKRNGKLYVPAAGGQSFDTIN